MQRIRFFPNVLFMVLILNACSGTRPTESEGGEFQHGFTGPDVAWNDQEFDSNANKFTFAVFSDLTGGERENVFSLAMGQLRLLRPEFMIGVGDLIDGGALCLESCSGK